MSTSIQELFQRNEYAYLYLRGTGLNNHNSTIFKVDDFTVVNHAYFKGLYLVVLDRRTLETVFINSYDTMKDAE